ncbi:MAG TPA: prepilin-type N-terminal cleavage/methylation domain-containing protein [Chromatiaceae bacterium]|nr:prepilin-type N-terminal cleavage/methylation domain-containing protein [Chromatiaceae bacterium]
MNKGFTLIELLMTIAILAIVMAIGVPSYRTLIQDNNLDARRSVLMRHLILTRSEAVERKRRVTICGVNNPNAGTPVCKNNRWGTKGWIVFVDSTTTGTLGTYDAGEEIIERFRPETTSITFVASNPIRKLITYSPDGTANNQGTFTMRDSREANNCGVSKIGRRCVVIANTGRVRTN